MCCHCGPSLVLRAPGAPADVVARVSRLAERPYAVRVQGELWSAWSPDDLAVGERYLLLEVEGYRLVVCRMPPELELS